MGHAQFEVPMKKLDISSSKLTTDAKFGNVDLGIYSKKVAIKVLRIYKIT